MIDINKYGNGEPVNIEIENNGRFRNENANMRKTQPKFKKGKDIKELRYKRDTIQNMNIFN